MTAVSQIVSRLSTDLHIRSLDLGHIASISSVTSTSNRMAPQKPAVIPLTRATAMIWSSVNPEQFLKESVSIALETALCKPHNLMKVLV